MLIRSTLKSVRHVWSQDPALDRSSLSEETFEKAWKQFLKTGDPSNLPVREGTKLAIFEFEPLSRKDYIRALNLAGLEQWNEAVACGLRSVQNFEIDGVPVQLERTEQGGSKRLSGDSLDKIFDPMLFMELGLRILDASRLHPTHGQG